MIHEPTEMHDLHPPGLLAEHEAPRVQAELDRGASLWTALASGADEERVWASLAEQRGQRFYARLHDLHVCFADLFDHRVALRHALLPHRTRGGVLDVLTVDPRRSERALPELPGYALQHALVPPRLWRTLYDLAYPAALTGRLTREEAHALVTLTRRGEKEHATPEQHAEILALTTGYPYLDPRDDPPDEAVRLLVSPTVQALTRAYPHRLRGHELVVLMADPEDMHARRKLEQQTQRPVVPAVAAAHLIDHLIGAGSA